MSTITSEQTKQIEKLVSESFEFINNTTTTNVLQTSASQTNAKLVEHILNKLTNDKFKTDRYCSRIYNCLVCIAIGIMLILVGLIVVFMIEPSLLGAEHNRDFKTIVQIITSNCTCEIT
jgi:uncharacterized membrane protein